MTPTIRLHLSLVLIFLLTAPAVRADDEYPNPRLRYTDALIAAMVARGIAHSPTFATLVDRIEASDVIVSIDRQTTYGTATGVTQFVTRAGDTRYARVRLFASDSGARAVALLGHELRHVVELVEAPWVVDLAGYGALYEAIGRAACGAPQWCFDTGAAVQAGRQVLSELARRSRRHLPRLAEARP